MPWNPAERAALADALDAAGPGAPTLCAGWASEHLAAHVVLRESAPLIGAGIVVPALAARTERATQALGDRSTAPSTYAALVQRLRTELPRWHPLSLAGDAAQLAEMFVHTEDVRRGGVDGPTVAPRPHPPGMDDALWQTLRRMRRRLYKDVAPTVVLRDGAGREMVVEHAGDQRVTITGAVGELVLHGFGRSRDAHVVVEGNTPMAVAALERTHPR